jgi:glycosyltransferase involved in cell wall biosynthesis
MKTVDALGAEGVAVELILPESARMRRIGLEAFESELRAFYALREPFHLRALRGMPPSRLEIERPAHAILCSMWLEHDRYDVLYTRSRSAALLCALRCEALVFETYRKLGQEHPLLVRAYARLAARSHLLGIVTHSDVARTSLANAGFPAHKLATIHNGYDPLDLSPELSRDAARAELGLPLAQAVCCYTGHVRARKGMSALLDVAALTPEVLYLIAGGHPEDVNALRKECARRGLEHVRCLGWRPAAELRPLLYAADLLIIPPSAIPLEEHGRTVLPMKIFSYLAAGRAILAPALPDLMEVLEHDHNAWLVPPDDAPASAAAMRHLIANPALRARLGAGATLSASGLTWRARAHRLVAQISAWQQAR